MAAVEAGGNSGASNSSATNPSAGTNSPATPSAKKPSAKKPATTPETGANKPGGFEWGDLKAPGLGLAAGLATYYGSKLLDKDDEYKTLRALAALGISGATWAALANKNKQA